MKKTRSSRVKWNDLIIEEVSEDSIVLETSLTRLKYRGRNMVNLITFIRDTLRCDNQMELVYDSFPEEQHSVLDILIYNLLNAGVIVRDRRSNNLQCVVMSSRSQAKLCFGHSIAIVDLEKGSAERLERTLLDAFSSGNLSKLVIAGFNEENLTMCCYVHNSWWVSEVYTDNFSVDMVACAADSFLDLLDQSIPEHFRSFSYDEVCLWSDWIFSVIRFGAPMDQLPYPQSVLLLENSPIKMSCHRFMKEWY